MNQLENLRPHDNQMYVHIQRLTNERKFIPPLNRVDELSAYTSQEKAETLADHFQRVHVQNVGIGDAAHDNHVDDTVRAFLNQDEEKSEMIQTNCDEVKLIVRSLKNKKAPGFDNMKSIVLKNFSQNAIIYVTMLINSMFTLSYFPESWKWKK